jgi:hypothetical protein
VARIGTSVLRPDPREAAIWIFDTLGLRVFIGVVETAIKAKRATTPLASKEESLERENSGADQQKQSHPTNTAVRYGVCS